MARSIHRRAPGVAAVLAILAFPAAASAASLKATVSPTNVRPGKTYTVKVAGSFKPSELRGTAYLWVILQYSSARCQGTAQAENALPNAVLSTDFRGKERGSPFTNTQSWRAGNIKGGRHVCAYLYPKVASATSTVRPIARADAPYRDV